ncbi:type VI secretion system baseplate subunit TssG [Candidatus Cytomitobacter primus]|uniref:Type VI secretion system baseplate subunit TssG n=1 Tax=Candidatus Cytomitobacter primus TaxID=2066024 RepID=A0A5C0UEH9_9PROT|nr:type VI secretion system baseplate subunit TssG [Candidatus Cytomitobacter primus]QEK38458.1 type VI secretion system baseplate subunit TssG [Candidatus Cytomitobacter primus]
MNIDYLINDSKSNSKNNHNKPNNALSSKLNNKLYQQPWKFSLHQFMYLASKINKPFKYTGNISLSISPSDVISVDQQNDVNKVCINGISLLGIQGSLPIYYINMMMDRKRNNDYALQDFLDIFNNKIIQNTFNIQKKSIFSLQNQKFYKTITGKVINSIGLGELHNTNKTMRNICTALPILFWSQKSPSNLVRILESFLEDTKVKCEQFIGKWMKIHHSDQTILSSNCTKPNLGSKFLGKKFWNAKHGIKIIINTKSKELYTKLLPNKPLRSDIEFLINSYIPFNIKFQLKLHLEYESQPTLLLGRQSVLSYFSWLNKDTLSCLANGQNAKSVESTNDE